MATTQNLEKLAAIIDPDAFEPFVKTDGAGVYWGQRRNDARRKAREVIAAFNSIILDGN
ncbi:hypothetical protein [Roseibium sp. Sym1]|uniref:hypothetical protein n=1 Tax=Roseibium sp. Sym1 TaxID=3016006 RepID=UPI0022B55A55|nr:hypothetical protein [Roseibium sp. Sym1]